MPAHTPGCWPFHCLWLFSFRKPYPPEQPPNWEGPVKEQLKFPKMFPTQPLKKGAPGRHRSRGRAHSPIDPGRGPLKAVPLQPHRPDSSPPYSRPHGRVQRHRPPTNRPCRGGLAPDRQDAEMALPPRGTRPQSHHRDQNQTRVQHSRQHPSPHRAGPTGCPVQGLGPQVARRARRGVGAMSSQRYPCPGTPVSVARSHTHFLHRRGLPPRTQVGTKRGKRSRMAGIRRGHARAPGECSQDLPGDRHPTPKKAFSQGTTQLCPGRVAGRRSSAGYEIQAGPSRAEASRVRV